MAANKLTDLNNHLFMQMERLGNEGLSTEQLQQEIQRTNAIAAIGKQIVANANLALNAAKFATEHRKEAEAMLPMLEHTPDPMKNVRFEDKA